MRCKQGEGTNIAAGLGAGDSQGCEYEISMLSQAGPNLCRTYIFHEIW